MKKIKKKVFQGLLAFVFALSSIVYPLGFMPGSLSTVQAAGEDISSPGFEERISGADRYGTAAKVSQAGWKGTSDYAVLSAGMDANLVDALAAAPLAKLKNAPILLTQGEALNFHAEAELKRLNVKTVYVTTGDKVITKKVLDRLAELKIDVISLGGSDRYDTAVNIAKAMGSFDKLVVATAKNNADALSIAAIAAAQGMPIILSDTHKVPDKVMSYIVSIKDNVTHTYILGGTGVLSDAVKSSVPNGVRIGGGDRYGTNLEILKTFANDLKYSRIYLANGEDKHLVDALAGAPLAAQSASPVLLTGKILPAKSMDYAKLNLGPNVVALGGEASVSKEVLTQLSSALIYSVDGAGVGSTDSDKPEMLNNTVKITGKNISVKNAKTAYSIYVQGDNVALDNVNIGGTLFLDPGAKGSAYINNVKAGKIVVLSGAKESIHLSNTEAGTLVVSSSSEVRVQSSGTTKVGNTVVTSYVILDAAGGTLGTVEVVTAAGQAPVVTLRGTFDQPIVVSGAATIKADANASIAELQIAPENKNQKVSLDGKFNSVVVNKEAQVDLSPTTNIATMVTNVKAGLNVPAGANIATLDKKGNDIPVTGTGNVGGAIPPPATGGGGGGGGVVVVTGITVTGAGGEASISEDGGTLQMNAAITPSNATNKAVTWSVLIPDGETVSELATINESGLLTAVSNGFVKVKATANDGSGKYGAVLVTISGQLLNGATGELLHFTAEEKETHLGDADFGFTNNYANAGSADDSVLSDALVVADKNVVIDTYYVSDDGNWVADPIRMTLEANESEYLKGEGFRGQLKIEKNKSYYRVKIVSVNGVNVDELTEDVTITFTIDDMAIAGGLERSLSQLSKTFTVKAPAVGTTSGVSPADNTTLELVQEFTFGFKSVTGNLTELELDVYLYDSFDTERDYDDHLGFNLPAGSGDVETWVEQVVDGFEYLDFKFYYLLAAAGYDYEAEDEVNKAALKENIFYTAGENGAGTWTLRLDTTKLNAKKIEFLVAVRDDKGAQWGNNNYTGYPDTVEAFLYNILPSLTIIGDVVFNTEGSPYLTTLVLDGGAQVPVSGEEIQNALVAKLAALKVLSPEDANAQGRDDIETIKAYTDADIKFDYQNIVISEDGKTLSIVGPVFSEAAFKVAKGAKSGNYETTFNIALYDDTDDFVAGETMIFAKIQIFADGSATIVGFS